MMRVPTAVSMTGFFLVFRHLCCGWKERAWRILIMAFRAEKLPSSCGRKEVRNARRVPVTAEDIAMNQLRRAALVYACTHRRIFLSELKEFLHFPSVSGQPTHAPELRKCAEWLARHLRKIGIPNVRILSTKGSPIVYGSWLHARNRPTLLIYGHYDVLPGEPLSEWRTPPFTPTVK